jgi:hypothetical protein
MRERRSRISLSFIRATKTPSYAATNGPGDFKYCDVIACAAQ